MDRETPDTAATRRAYPRYSVALDCRVRVDRGEELVALEATTVNLSRGGMLARLPMAVPAGTRCLVQFDRAWQLPARGVCPHCSHDIPGMVVPRQALWAEALRIGEGAEACSVAFAFESLLEILPPTEEKRPAD